MTLRLVFLFVAAQFTYYGYWILGEAPELITLQKSPTHINEEEEILKQQLRSFSLIKFQIHIYIYIYELVCSVHFTGTCFIQEEEGVYIF